MILKDSTKEQKYEYTNKLHREHRKLRENVFDVLPDYKKLDDYVCKTIYIDDLIDDKEKQEFIWKSKAIGFVSYCMSDCELLIKRIYIKPNYRRRGYASMALWNIINEFQLDDLEEDEDIFEKYFFMQKYTLQQVLSFLNALD